MKRWFADHIWIVFWIACLSQAALWIWWINYAGKHTPQRIEPEPRRTAVVSPPEEAEPPKPEPEPEATP